MFRREIEHSEGAFLGAFFVVFLGVFFGALAALLTYESIVEWRLERTRQPPRVDHPLRRCYLHQVHDPPDGRESRRPGRADLPQDARGRPGQGPYKRAAEGQRQLQREGFGVLAVVAGNHGAALL